MNKRGFTIVEMLMVIGVLAVLMGIITTAASSAIRQARGRRTEAARQVIKAGIATFYAQNGYWPPQKGGNLQKWAENGLDDKKYGHIGFVTGTDFDAVVAALVLRSVGASGSQPVLDPSSLIVERKSAADSRNARGVEFREAVKKQRKHGSTIKVNEMAFGYQERETGRFHRFAIMYNADSDSIAVLTESEYTSERSKAESTTRRSGRYSDE